MSYNSNKYILKYKNIQNKNDIESLIKNENKFELIIKNIYNQETTDLYQDNYIFLLMII